MDIYRKLVELEDFRLKQELEEQLSELVFIDKTARQTPTVVNHRGGRAEERS